MKYTPAIEAMVPPAPRLRVCSSRPLLTSQTLTESVPEAAAIRLLSLLKAMNGEIPIPPCGPLEILRNSRPVLVSQSLIELLRNVAVANKRPSGLKTRRVAPKKLFVAGLENELGFSSLPCWDVWELGFDAPLDADASLDRRVGVGFCAQVVEAKANHQIPTRMKKLAGHHSRI